MGHVAENTLFICSHNIVRYGYSVKYNALLQ